MINNIQKPKKCHCCGNGEYKQISELHGHQALYAREKSMYMSSIEDAVDTYICTNPVCKHVYRHYYEDISDFHREGGLRTKQKNQKTGLLDLGTPEKIQLKIQRAENQLFCVRDFLLQDDLALEIAPGRGFFLMVAKEYFKTIKGVDIDPAVVTHNKILHPNIEVKSCSFLDLSEDEKYDVILAFDFLEHIEELDDFVTKLHAITNKYAVIQIPVDRPIIPPNYHLLENPKKHQLPFDGHLHYFSEFSLNNLLSKNGLFECVHMYKTFPGETAGGKELLCVFKKI